MNNNTSLGAFGEKLACVYLKKQGYTIISTRWQKRTGEIDIIASDSYYDELAFIEVKTRKNTLFGFPEEKVTKQKLRKITKTAELFLLENSYPENQAWRIDVISILLLPQDKAEIKHFKNLSLD